MTWTAQQLAEYASKQASAKSAPTAPSSAVQIHRFTVPETAMGKPRMTRRDVWQKRPVVVRYRQFCDRLRECAGTVPKNVFAIHVACAIPMPESWSQRKKDQMCGNFMRQRPDCDNILKGIMDALFDEDSGISLCTTVKTWCRTEEALIEIVLFHF